MNGAAAALFAREKYTNAAATQSPTGMSAPACMPTTRRLIRDYAFRGFSPESVAVSGALTTAAVMAVGLAGGAVIDFRRGGPLSGAVVMAYLVVVVTVLTVLVAGVMDKRAHVRAGFVAAVALLAATLAGGAYWRRSRKLAETKARPAANQGPPTTSR